MKTQALLFSSAVLIQELYDEGNITYDVYRTKMNELIDHCTSMYMDLDKESTSWSRLKTSILELSIKQPLPF